MIAFVFGISVGLWIASLLLRDDTRDYKVEIMRTWDSDALDEY